MITNGKSWVASVLDVVIAIYVMVVTVVLLTGGFDIGLASANAIAKPLLVLLIAVPVRLAVGEHSWMTPAVDSIQRLLQPVAAAVGRNRISPAIRDVIFVLLVTRLATFFIGFVVNVLSAPQRPHPLSVPFRWRKLAETFAIWDSGWYFDIAMRGYYYDPNGQSSIAFFPLYPLTIRAAAWPFGRSEAVVWTTGIVVSCAAFGGALLALHRLTERLLGDREAARRTILYVAIFPFSFYFTRIYTEALFLLLTVLAVSSAYSSRWGCAGLFGGLATVTRPNGILIAIPLLLLALGGRPGIHEFMRRLIALASIPAALAGFCVYVYLLSGDPLGWFNAQYHWGYSVGHPPWQHLLTMLSRLERYGLYDYFFVSKMAPFRLFYGVTALLFLGLTPFIFRKFGPALGSYVLISLLVPLSGNALLGIGRYAAVLFPVFMLAGSINSRPLHEAIVVISSLFLALFLGLFVTWHPLF